MGGRTEGNLKPGKPGVGSLRALVLEERLLGSRLRGGGLLLLDGPLLQREDELLVCGRRPADVHLGVEQLRGKGEEWGDRVEAVGGAEGIRGGGERVEGELDEEGWRWWRSSEEEAGRGGGRDGWRCGEERSGDRERKQAKRRLRRKKQKEVQKGRETKLIIKSDILQTSNFSDPLNTRPVVHRERTLHLREPTKVRPVAHRE